MAGSFLHSVLHALEGMDRVLVSCSIELRRIIDKKKRDRGQGSRRVWVGGGVKAGGS